MKLVFILKRLGDNKFLAPLIREALSRNYSVELWLDHRDISQTTKWYEFPAEEKLPNFRSNRTPTCRTFASESELISLGERSDAQVLFSTYPIPFSKKKGQRFAHVVTSFYDSLCAMPASDFDTFDVAFFNSQRWIDEGVFFYETMGQLVRGSEMENRIRGKCVVTGTPQFDHFEFCDRAKTLTDLGLAPDTRIITVFAFELNLSFWCQRIFRQDRRWIRVLSLLGMPFTYPGIFSRIGLSKLFILGFRSLYERFALLGEALTCPSETDLLLAIREFAHRNGCKLILKARKKHNLSVHHLEIPDVVIEGDREFFPCTPNQLQSASDLVISFYSTSAPEAAAAGTPVLNIRPNKNGYYSKGLYDVIFKADAKRWEKNSVRYYQDEEKDGLFNSPGLVKSWTVKETIRRLKTVSLTEFKPDPGAHRAYVKRFITPFGGPSSDRILDFIAERDSTASD